MNIPSKAKLASALSILSILSFLLGGCDTFKDSPTKVTLKVHNLSCVAETLSPSSGQVLCTVTTDPDDFLEGEVEIRNAVNGLRPPNGTIELEPNVLGNEIVFERLSAGTYTVDSVVVHKNGNISTNVQRGLAIGF